ncbi:hypothetical protein N9Z65_00975 [bacterium]|nr:hypothetical protein [bacterium]
MRLISSVKGFINTANDKADKLTAMAKGALCLPSILSGIPDLSGIGKGIIGGVLSSANSILLEATSTISDLVTGAIDNAVNKITGAIADSINDIFGTINSLVAEVKGAIEEIKNFADSLSNKVNDIKDFTFSKENCDFAAASLLNCVTSEALSNLSAKAAIDVSKGLLPIDEFASDIADRIASPAGAINRTINKAANEIDRAAQMISKSDLF